MSSEHVTLKIKATLSLLNDFAAVKFPHSDSKNAVRELIKQIKKLLSDVSKKADHETLQNQSYAQANSTIGKVVGLLGYIANSMNVWNAFEIHAPVLHLAKLLLKKPRIQLILTFEWDYSPFTHNQKHPLAKKFIIIGLPAPEASNALVIPAVGHELGHSLWESKKVKIRLMKSLDQKMKQLVSGSFKNEYLKTFGTTPDFVTSDWKDCLGLAYDFANGQAEELFCDFVGLHIFGWSFLECFRYLLAPRVNEERDPQYPEYKNRAKLIQKIASEDNINVSDDYYHAFETQSIPDEYKDDVDWRFQLAIADAAVEELVREIADEAFSICSKIPRPDMAEAKRHAAEFLNHVPCVGSTGLAAILNAAWLALGDKKGFLPEVKKDIERLNALNELVLKSVEIYEIELLSSQAEKNSRKYASQRH